MAWGVCPMAAMLEVLYMAFLPSKHTSLEKLFEGKRLVMGCVYVFSLLVFVLLAVSCHS